MSRRPLHPEDRRARIARAADARAEVTRPKTDAFRLSYGWLLVLIDVTGVRHYEDVPSDVPYDEARARLDHELRSSDRYVGGWLIQKTFDPRPLTSAEFAARILERRAARPEGAWYEDEDLD